jgi:hypothetical protein
MRNQDILDRNPDIRQLKAIARAACTDYILSNPRLEGGSRHAERTGPQHSTPPSGFFSSESYLRSALGGARLAVWATALPYFGSHPRHNHEGNLCSGVFYVTVPDIAQPLVFDDPRGTPWRHLDAVPAETIQAGAADPHSAGARYTRERLESIGHWLPGEKPHSPFVTQHAFLPRQGDLIVFPPWLSHSVPPSNREVPPGEVPPGDGEEAGEAECAGVGGEVHRAPENGPSLAGTERRRCGDRETGKRGARRRGQTPAGRLQGTRISYAFNMESPSAMAAWALSV